MEFFLGLVLAVVAAATPAARRSSPNAVAQLYNEAGDVIRPTIPPSTAPQNGVPDSQLPPLNGAGTKPLDLLLRTLPPVDHPPRTLKRITVPRPQLPRPVNLPVSSRQEE